MKRFIGFVGLVCLLWSQVCFAVTVPLTLDAEIPVTTTASVDRDAGSVTRGTPATILFDRLDSADPGVSGPSATTLYAPYRSEVGKNWHVLKLFGNTATTSLTTTVTGTISGIAAATRVFTFCGGLFPEAGGVVSGTPSTAWETLHGFTRSVGPFLGSSSFNYKLDATGMVAGSYAGVTVTYTLTSL